MLNLDIQMLDRYIIFFMMFSCAGWIMETILVSIQNKKLVNRGFLIGPYCPIYGWGALSIIITLKDFNFNLILLFFMAMLVCGILEYFTSWIMEKVFKARWWDYSNRKFNIKGRVCLRNLIGFGVLGVILIYWVYPFCNSFLDRVPVNTLHIISLVFFIIYTLDTIISFIIVYGLRGINKEVNKSNKSDNTEEISKMVREIFSEKSFLHRRIINAYPRLESIKIKMKEIKTKIEDATNEARDVVAEKVNDAKDAVTEKVNDAKDAVTEKVSGAKDAVTGKMNDAKDAMSEKTEEIKNSIRQGKRKLRINVYKGKKNIKTTFKGMKLK